MQGYSLLHSEFCALDICCRQRSVLSNSHVHESVSDMCRTVGQARISAKDKYISQSKEGFERPEPVCSRLEAKAVLFP